MFIILSKKSELFFDQNIRFLYYFFRSTSPKSGDLLNGIARTTRANALMVLWHWMVAMSNICLTMDLCLSGARFKLNWLVCKPSLCWRWIKKLKIIIWEFPSQSLKFFSHDIQNRKLRKHKNLLNFLRHLKTT